VKVDKIVEAQATVTRAQAQREGKVKPLKAVSSIDCDLLTEEVVELQKKDESLSKWWQEAQKATSVSRNEYEPKYEIKNGFLFRWKEAHGKEVSHLTVPVYLRERVMKLAHESIEWTSRSEEDV